jgi:hypothetical protein
MVEIAFFESQNESLALNFISRYIHKRREERREENGFHRVKMVIREGFKISSKQFFFSFHP